MVGFILKRLLSVAFSIFLVSIIIFILMHSIPGGPFDVAKMPLSESTKNRLKEQYGLDKPLFNQYLEYMFNAIRLKFGYSFQNPGETVKDLIARTLPVSAFLAGMGLLIGFPLGICLGILSAVNRNTIVDYITTLVSVFGITVPLYVTSMLLVLIFAIWLGWLPAGGWGSPKNIILPIMTYSIFPTGMLARYTRSSILETLNQPFVVTAKAKGLPEWRVILKHTLRHAATPIITISLPMLTGFMTGSIFIEKIFRIPGLGKFFVTSIFNKDYPVLMTLILMVALMLGVTYLIMDILYAVVDPRVRLESSNE